MSPRAQVALAIFLSGTSIAVAARAEVTIDVAADRPGANLRAVWAYYGYDEANFTSTSEGKELLRTLAAFHGAPVHVRTHFLFNSGDGTPALKWGSTNVYDEDDAGNPVYDYTLLDEIMDATVDSGTFPLVELGFMPQALSTRPVPYENSNPYALDGGCFYPPDDYAAWGELIAQWARHVKVRYPDAESAWEWELWNEPDIGYWQGTFEEFARLYDHTEAALHGVLPDASLGGPAVARADGEFLTRFLEHCASGTNAVTGASGTRLDMVSFHAKGGVRILDDHVQMDLGNQLRLHRAGFEAVARSAFAARPIVISEADPDGCAACPVSTAPQHAYRNSPAYGAYEVAMMKRTLDLAEELEVDLRGVLTWAFTFPGSPYFAGYRALATNGIHLPVLNAFKLLSSLGGARLPVTSSGALPTAELIANSVRERPDVDALSVLDGQTVRVLAWNYHDDLVGVAPEVVTVRVELPEAFGERVVMTHTRVDAEHGDAHAAWEKQGRPETPSASELGALRAAMEPVVLEQEREVDAREGVATLSFELPRFGLSLLTLEPGEGPDPAAPRDDDAAPRQRGCSCELSPGNGWQASGLVLALAALSLRRRRQRASSPALER